jgi:hypothetical protein
VASDRIDELRRTAYPNEDRKGCPEPSAFGALNRREISFNDPLWDHIERCSPCYCQFADIREELFKQDRRSGLQRIARTGLIVLLLLVVGGGVYFWQRSRSQIRQPLVASNSGASAVLNFEDGSELRGAGTNRSAVPSSGIQHLPRNDLSLTVYLPLGSRAGEYELEILGSIGESVWKAKGSAAIKDGLTSIPVKGDLRNLAVGEYRFRFRRPAGDWHEKQVLVE